MRSEHRHHHNFAEDRQSFFECLAGSLKSQERSFEGPRLRRRIREKPGRAPPAFAVVGLRQICEFEINAEGLCQNSSIMERKIANDVTRRIEAGLIGAVRDGQFSKRLDFLEKSLSFLFLDDISKKISKRPDVAAQWFFFNVWRYAGQFVQPLMLIRRTPQHSYFFSSI